MQLIKMSDEPLAVISAETPTQPGAVMGDHAAYVALADECQAIVSHHKSRMVEVVFQMNWHMGLAVGAFADAHPDIPLTVIHQQLYSLGGTNYGYEQLRQCVAVVRIYSGNAPDGVSWSEAKKMIAPTADPTAVGSAVPTEHLFSNSDEKSEPLPSRVGVQRSTIETYCADKQGHVWALKDTVHIRGLLGYD
jgi:hypothetical protein